MLVPIIGLGRRGPRRSAGISTAVFVALTVLVATSGTTFADTALVTAQLGTASSCTPVVSLTELLTDPGFDSLFKNRAPGWNDNVWGGATVANSRVTSGQHSGAAAQRMTVTLPPKGAGVEYTQNQTFLAGQVYQASVWLRSPTSTTLDFQLRQQHAYYEAGAEQRVQLTPNWQHFVIQGGFSVNTAGFFGISFVTAGTVVIDDASLRAVSDTQCVATTAPIPATYFGMHVNKWGNYPKWPSEMNFGTMRLWDTGTTWADIEPQRGVWNWTRMDYYMKEAVANHEAVIYTMGQTPQWASARPNDPRDGAVAEPANIADWRTYVRAVATRYKGEIKYWEIWNESDQGMFYTGTPQTLVTLTSAARETLLAVDPTNTVLSPDFTPAGLPFMAQFLADGGGKYIDVMSVHQYPLMTPEDDRPFFVAVGDLMQHSGIGGKPIWNTEGAAGSPTLANPQAGGMVARAYLVQWAWGIQNFSWYTWEGQIGSPLSQADYMTPTAAGIAYEQVDRWLRGAEMLSRSTDVNGTWTITLKLASGARAYAVWNVNGPSTFTIPTGWEVAHAEDLTGATAGLSGASVAIGTAPLLLVR